MNSLRQSLEKWAAESPGMGCDVGAESMLDLLWPVIEAAQADLRGYRSRVMLEQAITELKAKLEGGDE